MSGTFTLFYCEQTPTESVWMDLLDFKFYASKCSTQMHHLNAGVIEAWKLARKLFLCKYFGLMTKLYENQPFPCSVSSVCPELTSTRSAQHFQYFCSCQELLHLHSSAWNRASAAVCLCVVESWLMLTCHHRLTACDFIFHHATSKVCLTFCLNTLLSATYTGCIT